MNPFMHPRSMHAPGEYITIAAYLAFLITVGFLFTRMNRNLSDYVRGGGMGAWWMVGASSLMAGVSAFTFTGASAAAYTAGVSLLALYFANCLAFLTDALFLARWFRQTRAHTMADVIRARFGPEVEQFTVYSRIILAPITSAIQLWALAVFFSSVFGFPLQGTIIVIGSVVVLYSTVGGRMGVMATDFLQCLILYPVTLLMGWLCLQKLGGFGAMMHLANEMGAPELFRFFKEPGEFLGSRFTWRWMVAVGLMQYLQSISMIGAGRYLSVKNSRQARMAALLSLGLMAVGTLVWFIPPVMARLLHASEVAAVGLPNPAEASYAVAAMHVLPNGMMAIMLVAMMGATMSSMDAGLNELTGQVARNLLPPLRRLLRVSEPSDRGQVLICKVTTLVLGAVIIGYCLLLSLQSEFELFDAYFMVSSVIGLPIIIPFLFGLYIKRLPRWSYFLIMGFSLVPSIGLTVFAHADGTEWTIQDRVLWILVASILGTVISHLFWGRSSASYRSRVEAFFKQLHTPLLDTEDGREASDGRQARIMGWVSIAGAGFLSTLFFLPNSLHGRLGIAFVVGFVLIVALLLLLGGRWVERREKQRRIELESARVADSEP